MRRLAVLKVQAAPVPDTAAIAAGLAILTSAALWPCVPAVTAMALVGLGATSATVARFRGTAAFVPVALVHLGTYGGLYAIFVGASLHAATFRPTTTLGIAAIADVFLSVIPVSLALERVRYGLLAGRDE